MDIDSRFYVAAEKYFTKISRDRDNSTVLQETVEIEKMRKEIVSLVDKAEKDGSCLVESKGDFLRF